MALSIDEINAMTHEMFVPKIADGTFESNPVMARLHDRGPKIRGGTVIQPPIMYDKVASAGAIRGAEIMNIDPSDQFTAAQFEWKEYYTAIVLIIRELLQNDGDAAKIEFASAKGQAAEMTLRDLMGTGLFSDGLTDTNLIDGLEAAIQTTNTYPSGGGGIDRTTNAFWQAGFRDTDVQDFTTVANIFPALQKGVGRLTQQPNSPTMIITTQDVFDAIFNAYEDKQRFNDSGLASLGFESILFRRIPIVVDSHCPVSTGTPVTQARLYFVNEDFLQLYTHQEENFKFIPFDSPLNQKVSVAKIYWTGNLIVNNPRYQGVYTEVQHTAP